MTDHKLSSALSALATGILVSATIMEKTGTRQPMQWALIAAPIATNPRRAKKRSIWIP